MAERQEVKTITEQIEEQEELISDKILQAMGDDTPKTAEMIAGLVKCDNPDMIITASSAFIKLKQMEKEKVVRQVPMTFNRIGWVRI